MTYCLKIYLPCRFLAHPNVLMSVIVLKSVRDFFKDLSFNIQSGRRNPLPKISFTSFYVDPEICNDAVERLKMYHEHTKGMSISFSAF